MDKIAAAVAAGDQSGPAGQEVRSKLTTLNLWFGHWQEQRDFASWCNYSRALLAFIVTLEAFEKIGVYKNEDLYGFLKNEWQFIDADIAERFLKS